MHKKAAAVNRKPNSVRLGARPCGLELRRDDHSSSPAIADGIKRPTRKLRTSRSDRASLFGLAPCGVLPATRVTTSAVRSYRTFSPLPAFALRPSGSGLRRGRPDTSCRACLAEARGAKRRERRRAVYFLCHFPSGYPDRALPGALPCGVRTFLPPPHASRASTDDRLVHCGGNIEC
jgi:hypothetical protein